MKKFAKRGMAFICAAAIVFAGFSMPAAGTAAETGSSSQAGPTVLLKTSSLGASSLSAPTFTTASSATKALSVSYKKIVSASLTLLQANEGSYTSVTANDNGALSIGFLQWHGDNALQVLRYILYLDSQGDNEAKSILGSTLYNEIVNTSEGNGAWSSRTLTSAETKKIRSLLALSVSETAQDAFAESYILSYINAATKKGITNAAALVFYTDIANQGGTGGASICASRACTLAGSYKAITLNELMAATMTHSTLKNYRTRRFSSYAYAASLGWSYKTSGDYQIAYASSGPNNTKSGIKWIQKSLKVVLNRLGSDITVKVTGKYDAQTKTAVKLYQKLAGLDVDGDAGPATVSSLLYDRYGPTMIDDDIISDNYKLTAKTVTTKATGKKNGIKLTWNTYSSAKGYIIYRKVKGGSWKAIKTVSGSTKSSYTDKTAKKGKTYYYRVRAYRTVRGYKICSLYKRSSAVKKKS